MQKQETTNYFNLHLNEETSRYVFRIIVIKEIMENPRKYGFVFRKSDLYSYPELKQVRVDSTISNLYAFAKEHNRVETLFGRVIHTPEINAKGPTAGFAKRAAINAPIQGTAADIIRRAMIKMPSAIDHLPAKMLLQVHDELLFEVRENAVDSLIEAAKNVMETACDPVLNIDVPLIVDAGQGAHWAEAH